MPGLGVADTARALAGIRDALRHEIHAIARQLLQEPRLELKATLAAHLHEDALTLRDIERRIEELGGADRAADATAQDLLGRIDPLVDEATLRILTVHAYRERRHADELDPRLHPARAAVDELDDSPHLEAAETAVRALPERDDPDFEVDMARIAADSLRHAIVAGREGADEHINAEQALHARLRERWRR